MGKVVAPSAQYVGAAGLRTALLSQKKGIKSYRLLQIAATPASRGVSKPKTVTFCEPAGGRMPCATTACKKDRCLLLSQCLTCACEIGLTRSTHSVQALCLRSTRPPTVTSLRPFPDYRSVNSTPDHLDIKKAVGTPNECSELGEKSNTAGLESGRARGTADGALIGLPCRLGAFGRECSFTYTLTNASEGAVISLRRPGSRSVAGMCISRRASRHRSYLYFLLPRGI